MADTTGIAWADGTVNFWWGCTEVSPGCDNCYARELAAGLPVGIPKRIAKWGPHERRVAIAGARATARRIARRGKTQGRRLRIFTNSMSDFFDNAVEPDLRTDAWSVIRERTTVDWLILTKRPQNIADMLPPDWGTGWPHVWLGVSAENQREADRRIPWLGTFQAWVTWISFEPLLEAIVWRPDWIAQWAVVGGESGPKRRDCGIDAILATARAVRLNGVQLFVKQDSAAKPDQQGRIPDADFIRHWPASPAVEPRGIMSA